MEKTYINDINKNIINIMEVCGTHTMSIARFGIKGILPENVNLISGPGCPVCVTPVEIINSFLKLSEKDNILIATYGDMLRVPGSLRGDNLNKRKAAGAKVEIVYSPMDAVEIAKNNPSLEVVFLGAGFETTAPGTAAAIKEASERRIDNFSVMCMLKQVEPALRKLIDDKDFNVQGFLCPGHVAVITGEEGFIFLEKDYNIPAVIAGFEPEEIMFAIKLLLKQIISKKAVLENAYSDVVSKEGNIIAIKKMQEVFEEADSIWRGLGMIEKSGLKIREKYKKYDAQEKFGIKTEEAKINPACRCGDVICGKIVPKDCPMFGIECVPDDAFGPCMVSSEGACAAAYIYA